MVFQPELESMPREQLEALQLERLQRRCCARVYENVAAVPREVRRGGLRPRVASTSLDDLAPRARSPSRTTCARRTRTACSPCRCATSCACTRPRARPGRSRSSATPQGDIDRWADLMARTYASAGAHRGRRRPGHLRLRPVHRRARRALRLRAPRRADHPGLRRQHEAPGADPQGLRRHRAGLHAELRAADRRDRRRDGHRRPRRCRCAPASSAPSRGARTCARRSRSMLGITAIDIYGLSEVMGPGVASECIEQNGLHVYEDHFLIEIVDPETLRAGAGRRDGRGRLHDAHQGRHPGHPLPHARHLADHPGRVRVRPHVPADGARHRPHRRHAHHPRRERLPEPDRAGAHGHPRRRAALPGRPHASEGALDHVEVHVEVAPDFAFDEIRALEALQRRGAGARSRRRSP